MYKIILTILIVILALYLYITICNVNTSISKYISIKSASVALFTKNKKENPILLNNMIHSTNDLLTLLDNIIDLDIAFRISTLQLLRQAYNMQNLDKDIKTIGDKVFNGLDKKIFTNPELCLTSEYLLSYITTQITLKLTNSMHQYNIGMYISDNDKDK